MCILEIQGYLACLWGHLASLGGFNVVITSTFAGNPQGGYYMLGRYGKRLPEDRHYIAGILFTNADDYVLSPLPFDIVSDNIEPE